MSFVLSKLGWALVKPGNVLAMLLVSGQLLQVSGRSGLRRAGWWLTTAGILAVVLITLLPIGQVILRPLEERFPQPDLPDTVDGIILLGGSVHTEMTADRGQPVLNGAAERITEFVKLARRYPDARLVFTGGSGFVFSGDLRETDVVAEVLDGLGFDISRILFERESRNTYENAVFTRALVGAASGGTWLIITSAAHMPRSVGIFHKAGWPVVAYPVDYRSAGELMWGPDLLAGLDALNEAMREWIGLVAYRIMGRTDSLFPGPA
ncbi:YdcF family protein [Skermanella pratensis]|uniref:YdcF family protein n=1 Tax=Skermanella pratensis TaxID=2233999 RepID=UPI00130105EF|nr:YdcF family protein [Skermanella pratensis]